MAVPVLEPRVAAEARRNRPLVLEKRDGTVLTPGPVQAKPLQGSAVGRTCGGAGQSMPAGVGLPTLRIDGLTLDGTRVA